MNQAERDAAYNNAAAVADSATLNAERRAASAAYRAAHGGDLDVPYGEKPRQKFDFYPGADPAAPWLVFIHGGYWQMNTREDFACLAEGVAAHGWNVAMPGYTLAPDASLREIVAEIFASLDWLVASGVKGKLVIGGWSAGAHLAALALAHEAVDAGLLVSGIYELGPIKDTYLNEKLQLSAAEVEAFSPLRQAALRKPAVIAYGTAELAALVDDLRRLHAMWPGSVLVPVEGANHFTILNELRSSTGPLTTQALALALN